MQNTTNLNPFNKLNILISLILSLGICLLIYVPEDPWIKPHFFTFMGAFFVLMLLFVFFESLTKPR